MQSRFVRVVIQHTYKHHPSGIQSRKRPGATIIHMQKAPKHLIRIDKILALEHLLLRAGKQADCVTELPGEDVAVHLGDQVLPIWIVLSRKLLGYSLQWRDLARGSQT